MPLLYILYNLDYPVQASEWDPDPVELTLDAQWGFALKHETKSEFFPIRKALTICIFYSSVALQR